MRNKEIIAIMEKAYKLIETGEHWHVCFAVCNASNRINGRVRKWFRKDKNYHVNPKMIDIHLFDYAIRAGFFDEELPEIKEWIMRIGKKYDDDYEWEDPWFWKGKECLFDDRLVTKKLRLKYIKEYIKELKNEED